MISASDQDDPLPPFSCAAVPERDRVRIVPAGELDIVTVPEMDRVVHELLAAGFSQLVVDLRELTFVDSTGLHLLLELTAASRRDGFSLTVVPGPPHVQRVFAVAGVEDAVGFEAA